jgi:hypothetical protein
MSLHQPRAKIKQPEGIHYMIQEYHYSESDAQDYINMLIEKSEVYISKKGRGEKVAQMLTLEQLETQLENIRKFFNLTTMRAFIVIAR